MKFRSDRLIYALCALTYEEIAVVEGERTVGKENAKKLDKSLETDYRMYLLYFAFIRDDIKV